MRTSLSRVLTVHKGIIFFSVLIGMRKGYFNVFSFQVYDVIQPFGGHIVFQQVFQSVAGQDFCPL